MNSEFRKLFPEEIEQLCQQQCSCEHWDLIEVAPGCLMERIQRVNFEGAVRIGALGNAIELDGGIEKKCGLYNATIIHCTIGNNVYISNVHGCIAHYLIEDDVVIENIYQLIARGISQFGNGIRVPVLNEGGGREVPLFDQLSAQMAYILAMYRHQSGTIAMLDDMIDKYARSISSDTGWVGSGTHIRNCGRLTNLRIGSFACLHGVVRATEGSINSNKNAPTLLGDGTIADEFILSSGSSVTDGTILKRCFVGQGCQFGKQFSAENSLFFANCEGFHGEACSVFAGPYTVTHHKSTLLIAGYYSFFNAGSGSNQSNHMYKLGPVHQGIMGRGSKTASEAYMMWPSRTGPFTMVKGHHEAHFDSESLPFSYLLENNGVTYLVPGANMQNVGTLRDVQKWANRDRRTDPNLLDIIHYDLFNPYTIGCVLRGEAVLRELKENTPNAEYFDYHGVRIKKNALERGIKLYASFIDRYVGQELVERIEQMPDSDEASLRKALPCSGDVSDITMRWVDVAGMLAPRIEVDSLCGALESGRIKDLVTFGEALENIDRQYRLFCGTYLSGLLQTRYHISLDPPEPNALIPLIERFKQSETELERMIQTDASKEFHGASTIGYGIDGIESARQADFEQVRGTLDMHPFVRELHQSIADRLEAADQCLEKLRGISQFANPEPQTQNVCPQADKEPAAGGNPEPRTSVNEVLAEHLPPMDVSHKMQLASISDLAAGIGLNDKFLFTRELFKSNPSLFIKTVSMVNQAKDLNEAMTLLNTHFKWDTEQPSVQKFLDLVKRRHLS